MLRSDAQGGSHRVAGVGLNGDAHVLSGACTDDTVLGAMRGHGARR